MNIMNQFLRLLQKHYFYILIFFIISFAVFFNTLGNEFAVIDDIPGYIENELIRDLPRSLMSLQIQQMVYGVVYHFFQINPLPLRILALINHAIAGSLLFFIIKHIFNKKVAFISVCLFLVHPVTTETINWISAQFYIVQAIFLYSGILSLIAYRKSSEKIYLYLVISLFALDILFIRHAWVFIYPFVIISFDYFFLESKKSQTFYTYFIGWIIPLVILFVVFNFSDQIGNRMASRSGGGRELQNQQALIPVIQGYPYSIYSMMRLYVFPKDLTIYYDGNTITTSTLVLMYLSFLIYISALIYFVKKYKNIAGLLVLLIMVILLVLSPIKVTWFITERYLYAGAGFYTPLLTLFLFYTERKVKFKNLAFYLAIGIFILYCYRTITRNADWKTPETLAKATIQTSPYTVRAYNDLAGYYVIQQNYKDAKTVYVQALGVSSSMTSVRNLGHIYLETEFDSTIQTISYPEDQIYNEALRMIQLKEYFAAAYYLNEVLAQNPDHTDALNRAAELYILYDRPLVAVTMLQDLVSRQIHNADTFYILAYAAYTEKDNEMAAYYITETLKIDPQHQPSIQLLNQL